ncbi:MAG: phage tail family protein [Candidatus Limiplasma sp.]|nr:phage tail family protein [Candidatus Limiplasma sp.]
METSRANVLIHRSDGQTFAMDDRPMGLLELKGVDAPAMEVFTEKNAVGDGDTVTGSRVAARDITIRAKSRGGVRNAILRARAVVFFDPQYTYDVDISYDGVTRTARDCRLKAVAIPSGSLYQPIEITATFLCPYGYLDGEGGMDGVDLNSITPRLGWPYVSMMKDGVPGKARSGLDDAPGMLFGIYNYDKTVTINNRGSAPTWVRGVFTAIGPGTVQNPKLIHGDAFVRVLYTMNPGDVVDIDTEKRIVRINGVNALNKIDKASSFGGMRVDPGYSVIGFDADTNPDQLSARVYFQIRYLGV